MPLHRVSENLLHADDDDASTSSTFIAELLVAKGKEQRAKNAAPNTSRKRVSFDLSKNGNVQGGSLYPLV